MIKYHRYLFSKTNGSLVRKLIISEKKKKINSWGKKCMQSVYGIVLLLPRCKPSLPSDSFIIQLSRIRKREIKRVKDAEGKKKESEKLHEELHSSECVYTGLSRASIYSRPMTVPRYQQTCICVYFLFKNLYTHICVYARSTLT